MTGFGKGCTIADGREFIVELKAVNHRFLDVNMRLPRSLAFLEDDIRKAIQARLSRGHIEVWVTYNNTRKDAHMVNADMGILTAYMTAFEEIKSNYAVTDDISMSAIARLPEVFTVRESDDDMEIVKDLCRDATGEACGAAIVMRAAEGKKLQEDIALRLKNIKDALAQIEERAPLVVNDYRERLNKRIYELLDGQFDEARFNQEVAFFADKCAIDEEIVRLYAHISHAYETFSLQEPVGRKLDFLVQEMNREANTIGSKASNMDILNNVVIIKSEIEKLREQIQNIE